MGNGIIAKIIYFWAFILGVAVFGKIFGYMEDPHQSVVILILAAIIYIVWELGRYMNKRRKEERAWQEQQARQAARNKKKRK